MMVWRVAGRRARVNVFCTEYFARQLGRALSGNLPSGTTRGMFCVR